MNESLPSADVFVLLNQELCPAGRDVVGSEVAKHHSWGRVCTLQCCFPGQGVAGTGSTLEGFSKYFGWVLRALAA